MLLSEAFNNKKALKLFLWIHIFMDTLLLCAVLLIERRNLPKKKKLIAIFMLLIMVHAWLCLRPLVESVLGLLYEYVTVASTGGAIQLFDIFLFKCFHSTW